ncbi:MAG TPA: BTAD domain-containing putative transcriptional regulator, partial [Streptosporangiaceae bacterium]|nr:BTAD domain-containing putative transcriptional regulator [Streptosporangiaceae bacterium]
MVAGVEFRLLGPFEVRRSAAVVSVPAGRQRALLAALLLNAGRVVPNDALIEVLWGHLPPATARASLHNHVKRLRTTLAAAGQHPIRTHTQGYLIKIEPGALDVTRFEALLVAARAAARDGLWDRAAGQARAALALWRGEPLADAGSEVLALRETPRLAEMRLQALEVGIEAELRLGQHAKVIAELLQLVAGHPLRERLRELLMLAFYYAGRRGEALAAYQEARQVLVEELAVEPGPGLRELHHRMLTGDADLAVPVPAPAALATPRLLPALVPHFVGRAGDLARLAALLAGPGQNAPGPAVIGGTAGVGKTALALRWAHGATGRFPDGQLYVNLRGYDPGQPMPAADALAGFLRTVGLPGRDIPAAEEERAAVYRSLLAGRRVLVVLDNAGSAEQVRPLLPGSPTCAVLVTSRDS